MATIDREFAELCKKILNEGKEYEDKRRDVKRLQIPSYTFRHEFKDGFPAITNKKLYWRGIVGELIWFLRGDNDVKYLNDNGIKIWNKDAYNWYKKITNLQNELYQQSKEMLSEEEFNKLGYGSVGQNYSVQWRNFGGKTDQIKKLVDDMRKDVMSSRLKVNAWNPCEVDMTALPPCHSEFQIIGVPLEDGKFGFELHWNQRSVDTFLGAPYNIASYGLLAKILESITGFKALAIEGTLKCVHFYDNQYEAARTLVSRNPDTHPNCELELRLTDTIMADLSYRDVDSFFNEYEIKDFKLIGYTSDEEIKVEMLAPKE
jgi:thymidylate synthase